MDRTLIFDLDDTLTERYADTLKPEVVCWLRENKPEKIAICTNQGGVGLRHWMETDKWGDPKDLPTEESVLDRLATVKAQIQAITEGEVYIYISFAYCNKHGTWAMIPKNREGNREWSKYWRKPSPGMLIQAAMDLEQWAKGCTYVGNGDVDWIAARACEMGYLAAQDLFV